MEGMSKRYYENGVCKSIDIYKNGKLIKQKTFDENGKLEFEEDYTVEDKDSK